MKTRRAIRKTPDAPAVRTAAVRYGLLMLMLLMSWVFWYVPRTPELWWAYLAAMLQAGALATVYVAFDSLIREHRVRFVLAGLVAVVAAVSVIDAVVIEITTTPLMSAARIIANTASLERSLMELGISSGQLAALGIGGLLLLIIGGILHRVLPRHALDRRTGRAITFLAIALPVMFLGEQAIARFHSPYALRAEVIPLYLKLFSTAAHAPITVRIPPPLDEGQRAAILANVGPPARPKNVLYFMLESVRSDVIDPTVTPTLWSLSRRGLNCTNARTEGILTTLAWNVLLMDRPAWTFHDDMRLADREEHAAWPLRILHQAGYDVRLAISSDFESNLYARRIGGTHGEVREILIASEQERNRPEVADALAADRVIEWLAEADENAPFFYMLQLDCTHWDYYFDDASVVAVPFADEISPDHLMSQEQVDLTHNRYLNASRFLDNTVARVLAQLEGRGLAGETVIVVTSDHGEGFVTGRVGHSVLHEETCAVPLFTVFPDRPAEEISPLVSHRDIFPTLFDYLGVPGVEPPALLGRSLLRQSTGHPVLTMHGTLNRARLELPEGVISFETSVGEHAMILHPVSALDAEGRSVEMAPFLERVSWQDALRRFISGAGPEPF